MTCLKEAFTEQYVLRCETPSSAHV